LKDLIKLIFLGTAGYHPTERRQTVSVMIPSKGFILDAGTGFFRARRYIKTSKLHIFLSHPHHDHIIGLTYYHSLLHETKMKEEDINIYGIGKHLKAVQDVLVTDSLDSHLRANFQPIPLGKKFFVQDVEIEAISLPHKKDVSVGYKFNFPEGKSLAYITDTTCSMDYVDFIREVDLLIHECYLPDDHKEFARTISHSWTSGVNGIAQSAGVKRLALTHFNPVDESEDPTYQKNARIKFRGIIVPQDLESIHL